MGEMMEKKQATIESLADDMGGGKSWCSNCDYGLDRYLNNYFSTSPDKRSETGLLPKKDLSTFIQKNKMECPECESELEYSSRELKPYEFGGSDF
jgi:hypothetical protein